jgi:hypothetical protein
MKLNYLDISSSKKLPKDLGQFSFIELTQGRLRRQLIRLHLIGPKFIREYEDIFANCCWECGEMEVLPSLLTVKLCQECAEKIMLRK